jgi:hypothetical protein
LWFVGVGGRWGTGSGVWNGTEAWQRLIRSAASRAPAASPNRLIARSPYVLHDGV